MKRLIIIVLAIFLLVSCAPKLFFIKATGCEQAAYEGFGAGATGGSTVYHVTNLNDFGPGSLREALFEGGRCIVFDVGGTINLSSYVNIKSNTTIDGLTAPRPGVTIVGGSSGGTLNIVGVNNIIVRGVRVRDVKADGITVYNSRNVVIDHVSVSGFGDGAVDITEGSSNVTLSWSILGNGVENHNFVTLINYDAERISVHHNLYSNGWDRNPKCSLDDGILSNPSSVINCDVRNNLVWNYRYYGSRIDYAANSNVINNYYYTSFAGETRAVAVENGARVYTSGNYSKNGYNTDRGNVSAPFLAAEVETQDAITAAYLVLNNAGARGDNFGLDSTDVGYVSQVTIIDTPPQPAPDAGKLFGPFDYVPDGSQPYTLTRLSSPSSLDEAQSQGVKVLFAPTWWTQIGVIDGCINKQEWKRQFDIDAPALQPYVDDGTVVGLYALDEPFDNPFNSSCPVSIADMTELCDYSRVRFPNLPCGYNAPPTFMKGADVDYLFTQTNFIKTSDWDAWATQKFAEAAWFDGPMYLSINAYTGSPTEKQINDAAIALCNSDAVGVMMWKWIYVQNMDLSRAVAACSGQVLPTDTPVPATDTPMPPTHTPTNTPTITSTFTPTATDAPTMTSTIIPTLPPRCYRMVTQEASPLICYP